MEFVYLSSSEMVRADDLAVNSFNLQINQMMENAGRNLARFIADFRVSPKKIVALYGKGNNGGDALCAARHLKIQGFDVSIIPAFHDEGNKEVENQLKILKKMKLLPEYEFPDMNEDDIIIDGLLGYSIQGSPRGRFAELIKKANSLKQKGIKIVSYDLPSGTHPDTGECFTPCIDADFTLTLALPKKGLKTNEKKGKLFLVNIGIPNEVYEEMGFKIKNYFKFDDVVKVSG